MTHTCPCGNPVLVDGPLPTGFPFGPPEVNLAYHYGCAEKLGVPRPRSHWSPSMKLAEAEEKISTLGEQLAWQQEGYIGRGPDGFRMALVVEEDHSASLEVIRWVGEGTDRHVECWVLSPEEALRLLLLGASADRQASNHEPSGPTATGGGAMKPITTKEAVAYVRRRRGEIDDPQPGPTRLGDCINVVLDAAESAESAKAERNKEHVYTLAAKKLVFEAGSIMRRWGFLCPGELDSWMARSDECLSRRMNNEQAPDPSDQRADKEISHGK